MENGGRTGKLPIGSTVTLEQGALSYLTDVNLWVNLDPGVVCLVSFRGGRYQAGLAVTPERRVDQGAGTRRL